MKSSQALVIGTMILFSVFFLGGSALSATDGWVKVSGTVSANGTPLCAMVLANGQYTFTCSAGDGSFYLTVPPDANNQILVYAFCSGRAPYKQLIASNQGANMQIDLEASEAGKEMVIANLLVSINSTSARLTGTVKYDGSPLCAMVLANGKYQFTCSGDGSYQLDNVPLDPSGKVTLQGFCSGFPPYRQDFTPAAINAYTDTDRDGYSINAGDCNDLDASISPGATDICGDGIDQDCSGADEICVADITATGNWSGSWYNVYAESGSITARITQSGSQVSGSMDVSNTDCGYVSNVPLSGSEQSEGVYVFSASTVCQGAHAVLNFWGTITGDTMSGDFELTVNGMWYDEGTFSLSR